jgi:hypothetical protein
MNANRLIIDYVAMCTHAGKILDFADFASLWILIAAIIDQALEDELEMTAEER